MITTLIFNGNNILSNLSASAVDNSTRDAAYWPFDAKSPWNMPIGSKAQFQPPTSPKWTTTALKYGLIMTSKTYSIPIYIAKASDPVRKIYRTSPNQGRFIEQRVPNAAVPATGSDAHLSLIDETHSYVTEMFRAKLRSDGNLEAAFPNKIDLRGTGVFPDYRGSCAYGGSCIGGLIRKGELKTGIKHALRMSITPEVLNQNGPGGKPYIWPANSADGSYKTSYTGTGNIYMGSLLAIPGNVDIEKIAGPKGTPAYNLAKALQDYGAYVVDRGYLNFYVEPSAADEAGLVKLDYKKEIPKYLQVVTNSRSNNIGGGGTPRAPLAPPIRP